MTNLIINGIDHGKLDIEWAKRGGVLVSLESDNTRINLFKFLRSITSEKIEVSTMSQICFVTNFYEYRRVFRMATPSECAEAGIEYIEPMHAEIDSLKAQLAEARKDSERLAWVVSADYYVGFYRSENHSVVNRLYWIDGIDEIARGKTPREAIDNAMKGGE